MTATGIPTVTVQGPFSAGHLPTRSFDRDHSNGIYSITLTALSTAIEMEMRHSPLIIGDEELSFLLGTQGMLLNDDLARIPTDNDAMREIIRDAYTPKA